MNAVARQSGRTAACAVTSTAAMIIHIPEIANRDGRVYVSARIETASPVPDIPQNLWFSFPAHHLPPVSARADSFAASLLILAMFLGEDMHIRGQVSPRLVAGMQAFVPVFSSWFPRSMRPVGIIAPDQVPDPHAPSMNAAAFSGGLDSFFTLWETLPENQPDPAKRLAAGIFIHGFDQRLDDLANRRLTVDAFTAMFHDLGLEFYSLETNIVQFSEFRLPWSQAYAAPLAGAMLNFAPLFNTIYLPTADEYLGRPVSDQDPVTDGMLSTEAVTPRSHGHFVNRRDKLEAILQWPPAQRNLRVCYDKVRMRGVQNCSRCDKCLTLMTDIELSGMLPHFTTFDGDLSWSRILYWGFAKPIYLPNQTALRAKARRRKRWDIYLKLWLRLVLGLLRQALFTFLHAVLPQPLKYRLKRLVFIPEKDPPLTPSAAGPPLPDR